MKIAWFAGLYLSGLAVISSATCYAFVPPDNGGPTSTIGTGTRLHRGSGR